MSSDHPIGKFDVRGSDVDVKAFSRRVAWTLADEMHLVISWRMSLIPGFAQI